ncbi:hypothetical protein SAMN05444280_11079 [Tangfeifania diversioriginum]|uniref:Uncharacterized protein n=1 Tax=Tangfeifania diversioriginum TaxID=1168035 RepID=A0A1M6G978_9BACT|nr:hypothetical protein [Tangfeifania diversioriginum]SHJ06491.1 hypothetical protein SAMN05444280_11079 [Tangfeifania diversioriginum]
MDEELLEELNKIIIECFNHPPIALYKGINPNTRKAVNTAMSLNLIYESRPHQYKLNDNGMRVIQLGSIEKYLSELESKYENKSTHITNHGNFVMGDNSGNLRQSSDSFENNTTTINPSTPKATRKNPIISILSKFWWLLIIPVIAGVILILIQKYL